VTLEDYILGTLTSCKLWIPFRLGMARDLGTTGHTLSYTGTPKFTRSKKGWCFAPVGMGRVNVADHADFDLSENDLITVVVFASLHADGVNFALLDGRTGAVGWSLEKDSADKLSFQVNGGALASWVSASAMTLTGKSQMYAAVVQSWDSATEITAKTFVDGIVELAAASKSIGGDADPARALYVGADNTPTYGQSGAVHDVMFFDGALDEEQLGIIKELWDHSAAVGMVRPKGKRIYLPVQDTTALIQLASPRQGTVVEDLSNTGHQATVGPNCVTGRLAPAGQGFQFDQDLPSELTVADAADLQDTAMTAMAWIKTSTIAAVQRWMAKGHPDPAANGIGWACGLNTDGDLTFERIYTTGVGLGKHTEVSDSPVAAVGEWVHAAVTYTPGTVSPLVAAKLYANGALVASTEADPTAIALRSDATKNVTVGNDDNDDFPFQGLVADARFYGSELTAAQIYAIYLEGAKARLEEQHRFTFPETPASRTPGDPCGAYRVGSGTFDFVDDGSARGYVCSVAGHVVKENHEAFGSWYTKITPADGKNTYIAPVVAVSGAFGTFTGNYLVATSGGVADLVLMSTTPATIIDPGITLVEGTEYQVFLTRTTAQGWELWIKGGAWTDWTSLGTGTNTTFMTSAFAELDMDSSAVANVSSELKHLVGGYVADPADLGL